MNLTQHTHTFEIPTATKKDVFAGIATDKMVVPAILGTAALEDAAAFASAEQGLKADNALLKQDVLGLAFKDKIKVSDIEAEGSLTSDHLLAGDGTWRAMASFDITASQFDMANMKESANNKILTSLERQAIAANSQARHSHSNKSLLDSFSSDGNGALWWNSTLLTKTDQIQYSHANLVINGAFNVNQRGGSRDVDVGVYGYDRWKGHSMGLEQVVEALSAGVYTLTWTGGGNGSLNGVVEGTSPLVGKLSGGDISVIVPKEATNISLVAGNMSQYDPFQPRPYGQELSLCQRYFLDFGDLDGFKSYYWTVFHITGLLQQMRQHPKITCGALINVDTGASLLDYPEINVDNNLLYVYSEQAQQLPVMAWMKLQSVQFDSDF